MELLQQLLVALWFAFINSPEAVAIVITFILTIVPGPFRGVVKSVLNWFLTKQMKQLEVDMDHTAEIAVLAAEDYKQNLLKAEANKQDAGVRALDEAIRIGHEYDLFINDSDAEARIRAKYQELKGINVVE